MLCAGKMGYGREAEERTSRNACSLHDEKPTVVRQCIAALHEVALYRPELCGEIREELNRIDVNRYKDSMSGLILKDIGQLLTVTE